MNHPGAVEQALRLGLKPDCRASRIEYLLLMRKKYTPVWNADIESRMRREIEKEVDAL